jgi:hypothetical protein
MTQPKNFIIWKENKTTKNSTVGKEFFHIEQTYHLPNNKSRGGNTHKTKKNALHLMITNKQYKKK